VQQCCHDLCLHGGDVRLHIHAGDATLLGLQAGHLLSRAPSQLSVVGVADTPQPQHKGGDAPLDKAQEVGRHRHKLRMVHQAGGQHLPGDFTPAQQGEVVPTPSACPVPNAV
jgi:hypothetical protein